MTKITSMSSGAIDPIAQSKRVFFRPVDPTDVLKVGYAVCYNSDSVLDHKERAVDPTHLGLTIDTYAEGAQDFTGRIFIVEKPSDDNEEAFAGIVKVLGPKAGADGDMVEIWVPNGAMLPCYVEADCVVRRTPLYVKSGSYYLNDDGSKIVGLAQETITRTTAGLCWAKVDRQLNLNAISTVYLPAASGDARIKQLQLRSDSTVGTSIKAYNLYGAFCGAGTGGCDAGFVSVTVDHKATSNANAIIAIKGEARVRAVDGVAVVLSADKNLIGVMAAAGCPDAAGVTMTGNVYALHCKLAMSTDNAGNAAQILFEHTGGNNVDFLFEAMFAASINASEFAVANGNVGAFDGDAFIYQIPIDIAGTTYYLLAGTPSSAAD